MAFMDFAQPLPAAGIASASASRSGRSRPAQAGFTRTEWQIIHLARGDGLASLRAPGRWDRFLALVFGARKTLTLASERLEALRRMAVDGWHHGYAVPPSSLRDFRDAGFNDGQLELLLGTISTARTTFRRRSFS
ncbi:hypothetical protein [Sphingobium aquiterrae]|uniref:hypothetical protein n=1 Tax=Sphingobium aquiterrae TaxID=2038656 RepID=UPI003018F60D